MFWAQVFVLCILCIIQAVAFIPAQRSSRIRGEVLALNLFNRPTGTSTKKGFTVTVKQRFYKDADLEVNSGTPVNLRKELLKNGIDVYPLQGKIYNCGGGGSCGTCAVELVDGEKNVNNKSPVESRALKGKDRPNLRLSCCTRVSGPVTISTKP